MSTYGTGTYGAIGGTYSALAAPVIPPQVVEGLVEYTVGAQRGDHVAFRAVTTGAATSTSSDVAGAGSVTALGG